MLLYPSMKSSHAFFPLSVAVLSLAWPFKALHAGDWPQWGHDNSKNMVSPEKNLPDTANPGEKEQPLTSTSNLPGDNTVNIKWVARLASHCYGSPVVSGGKVFVGTNSDTPYDSKRKVMKGGAEICFDEATGKFLWELSIPTSGTIKKDRLFNYDHMNLGVCSTAAVEGNRLYMVSNRDEMLCLDTEGQANGNDGPFKDESEFMTDRTGPDRPAKPAHPVTTGTTGTASTLQPTPTPLPTPEPTPPPQPVPLCSTDGDIVWRCDMVKDPDINCWPQDAADCSVLVLGDYVYVCPSNGVNSTHKFIPHPNAPSLVVFDKKTGKVLARDYAYIGPKIFHGDWSSPSTGVVNGRQLIFLGGGDGVCYAFDAIPTTPPAGQKLPELKTVWHFDLNAAAGRKGAYKTKEGPSEILATPVFWNNRVYIASGQDPTHGLGRGQLFCIDPSREGDITVSGKVWMCDQIDRSLSTVAIADGLLFTTDNTGRVYCFAADTGALQWMHDTKDRICCSPVVADRKVYVGTDKGSLFIFAESKDLKLINTINFHSGILATPAVANGAIFVATQHWLYALALPKK